MRRSGRIRTAAVRLMLVGLVTLPQWSWGQATDRIGTVLVVENVAEVQAQDATEWERLRFRDTIFLNDTVRTGADSKVKVLLRDDSIMTLGERGEMQFTEFLLTQEQRRSVVSLLLGTVRVITTRIFGGNSATEVHTPNTVAGVRGTDMLVSFTPPDLTDVIVRATETGVTVKNPNLPQEVAVGPNFRTQVTGNTAPTTPTAVPAVEMQEIFLEVSTVPAQVPEEVTPTEELEPIGTPRGETEALSLPSPPLPPLESFPTQLGQDELEDQLNQASRTQEGMDRAMDQLPPDNTPVTQNITDTTDLQIIIVVPR